MTLVPVKSSVEEWKKYFQSNVGGFSELTTNPLATVARAAATLKRQRGIKGGGPRKSYSQKKYVKPPTSQTKKKTGPKSLRKPSPRKPRKATKPRPKKATKPGRSRKATKPGPRKATKPGRPRKATKPGRPRKATKPGPRKIDWPKKFCCST